MSIITKPTYKGQDKIDTLSSQLRIEDGNNRLLLFDGTVNRMIIGLCPDGTIGIVISKPGIDVLTLFS